MKKYLPILKNSPFFKGLTDNEILSVLHCVEAVTVSKGISIVRLCSYYSGGSLGTSEYSV